METRDQIIELGKLLRAEQEHGCADSLVSGGLEHYLAAWRIEHRQAIQEPPVRQALDLLAGYSVLDLPRREEHIQQALEQLRALFRNKAQAPVAAQANTVSANPMGRAVMAAPQPAAAPAKKVLPAKAAAPLTLDSPLEQVSGVGKNIAQSFRRLGVRTVRDLLYHFPHRYDDYSKQKHIADLQIGEVETVVASVVDVRSFGTRSGMSGLEVLVGDQSGTLKVVFFRQPWLAKQFLVGNSVVLSGKVESYMGLRQMTGPDWEPYTTDELVHTGRLVPVHPLTKGLIERSARSLIKQVVDRAAPMVEDHLPAALRERAGLLPLGQALSQAHFPDSQEMLERARRRLGFDEFILIQLGVLQRKLLWQKERGYAMEFHEPAHEDFLSQLPFEMTGAQVRALEEIFADMGRPMPMARLLQGDVGSGKTAVAAAASIQAIASGFQVAIMAPTEILAEQHYKGLKALLSKVHIPREQGSRGAGEEGSRRAGEEGSRRAGEEETQDTRHKTGTLEQGHHQTNYPDSIAEELENQASKAETKNNSTFNIQHSTSAQGHHQANEQDDIDQELGNHASNAEAKNNSTFNIQHSTLPSAERLHEIQLLLGMVPEDDLDGQGVRVALLTGSLGAKEKRRVLEAIANGDVDLIIGTHALITDTVRYAQLGLVIVDEQHRFGVEQRQRLRDKGFNPHLLVMTATPIPRTLTLTVYGDLDTSVLDELPPGRQEIRTRWITTAERDKAYKHIRQQVSRGRQAFVVCPLVDESEKVELPSAEEMYVTLQSEVFPDLRIALIHGKMLPREKDEIMVAFRNHEYDVLVATAVIEVGIDVPNATTMMIEGAERFGLAQLHQFRGRVGRGVHQSFCVLISDKDNEVTKQRLEAMEQTRDGFKLAEIDLQLRGPGEFFGTRQSGTPDLKIAQLADTRLLHAANLEARKILADDPQLSQPQHALLKAKVDAYWAEAIQAG